MDFEYLLIILYFFLHWDIDSTYFEEFFVRRINLLRQTVRLSLYVSLEQFGQKSTKTPRR
nr:MAG TPA: hypothetical protein [Caudoviricetes sp.]DAN49223.1 MAG TPA: hypothetical protein [Caudoviricetes sp.]